MSAAELTHLTCDDDLASALNALAGTCHHMAHALEQCGVPALRRREPGFTGLAAIVTGQQLSTASARSIWNRMETGLSAVTRESVARAGNEELGSFGLSRPKIRTLRNICAAIDDNALDFDALVDAPDEAVHERLTAITGIGPWTADIFLLFCLGRADAWPAGDLAVVEAVRMLRDLPERPKGDDAIAVADIWRPYRGAAAHLLWAYYAHAKGRSGTPDTAAPDAAA